MRKKVIMGLIIGIILLIFLKPLSIAIGNEKLDSNNENVETFSDEEIDNANYQNGETINNDNKIDDNNEEERNLRTGTSQTDEVLINDDGLREYLIQEYDVNHDNVLSISEMDSITSVSLDYKENIQDLSGLKYANNLEALTFDYPTQEKISSLEELIQLKRLSIIDYEGSDSINFSAIENLTSLEEISINANISDLNIFRNQTNLKSLDINQQNIDPVIDIELLASLDNLESLKIHTRYYAEIRNIHIINNMKKLRNISISGYIDLGVISPKEIKTYDYSEISPVLSLLKDENSDLYNKECSIERYCNEPEDDDESRVFFSDINGKVIIEARNRIVARYGYSFSISIQCEEIDVNLTYQYKVAEDGDNDRIIVFEDEQFKQYLLNNAEYDIDDDGEITEFDMHNLKQLGIYSDTITSIGGIENAINLEELNISDRNIIELTQLINLDKLKKLHTDANQIVDYESISKINSLEELELYGIAGNTDISEINKINQIKKFKVYSYNTYESIKNLSIESLKELELDIFGQYDVKGFESMPNLEKITLKNADRIDNITTLLKCSKLEEIHIGYYSHNDIDKWNNFEEFENFDGKILIDINGDSNRVEKYIELINDSPECVVPSGQIELNTNLGIIQSGRKYEIAYEELSPFFREIKNNNSKIGRLISDTINASYGYEQDGIMLDNENQKLILQINNTGSFYRNVYINNNEMIGYVGLTFDVSEDADNQNQIVDISDEGLKNNLLKYDLNGDGELSLYEMGKIDSYLNLNNIGNLNGLEYAVNVKNVHITNDSDYPLKDISNLDNVLSSMNKIENFNLNGALEDITGLDEALRKYSALKCGKSIYIQKDLGNILMNSDLNFEIPNVYFQLIEKYENDYWWTQDFYTEKNQKADTSIVGKNMIYIQLSPKNYEPNSAFIQSFSMNVVYNVVFPGGDTENEINFNDLEFDNYVKQNCDVDGDGKITEHDILNITSLDLTGNITNLKGINKFRNLRDLWVDNTKITNINDIFNNSNLENVYLSNNFITDITSLRNRRNQKMNIYYFESNFIDFSNNSENTRVYKQEFVNEISEGIYNEYDFTEDYVDVMISQLAATQKMGNPANFDNEVIFGDNRIKEKLLQLGADLNQDGKLTRRELYEATEYRYDNESSKVKAVIEKLDLSGMQISDISGLEYLSNLRYLDLSNNNIKNISALGHLFNLDYLNLSNNKIENIDDLPYYSLNCAHYNFNDEKTYKQIILSNNRIKDISCLGNWICLKDTSLGKVNGHGELYSTRQIILDLSNNEIENVDVIKKISTLIKLDLSGNKVRDISCLKDYNFEVNSREYWNGYFEAYGFEDAMYEQLDEFEGIDLSNNNINLLEKNNREAIKIFEDKGILLKVDNQAVEKPSISYCTHIQNLGWQKYMENGQMAGTSGKSLRLEGIKIGVDNQIISGDVEYSTHVQNIGWQGYVKNNQMAGTLGKSLRLEGIKIRLTGELAERYDVYYRTHCQNFGWLGWAKNGEESGSSGYAYRLEAIEIQLVEKGNPAPGSTTNAFRKAPTTVTYSTHIQNIGWQSYMKDGQMAGTTGQSLRLEGIKIDLENKDVSGGIEYCTHVENIGWQKFVGNGQMAGTSGQSLRLEGIRIRLTGELAKEYDVYYRTHCQNFGWLGWAKNGEESGSSGYAYRLEGIEIQLVRKGETPPKSNVKSFQKK